MHRSSLVHRVIRRVASFAIYLVLQVAFLPLALVGAALVISRQLVVSRRLGVSHTAIRALAGRWTMHIFGIRNDPAALQLFRVLPNVSVFGFWLVFFPLWAAYRTTGATLGYPRVPPEGAERIGDLLVARTLYLDRILARRANGMEQVVVLGAGYDTRAYGAPETDGLAWFELDRAATQRLKAAALRRAGVDAAHVTLVEVDFSREDAFAELLARGYDPQAKTLFLWEGVTLYLQEQEVRKTLRDIRRHAAPGSVLAADFYGERMIRAGSGALARKTLAYTNEVFRFGLPFGSDWEQTLHRFLAAEGLLPAATYFLGRANPRGPFAAVVECRLSPDDPAPDA